MIRKGYASWLPFFILSGGRLPPLRRHKSPFIANISLPLRGEGGFCRRQNSDEVEISGNHAGSPLRFYGICHNFSGRCGHRPLRCHKSFIQQIFCSPSFYILNFAFNNSTLGGRQIAANIFLIQTALHFTAFSFIFLFAAIPGR